MSEQQKTQHIVLLEPGLNQLETKDHELYLKEQHVDAGITDQKFSIGSNFKSYVFDTPKATKQLAAELNRAATPSVEKKVISILNNDVKVKSVEKDGEIRTC